MASCVKQEANVIMRGIQSGFCLGGDFIIEFSPSQYDATWHSYRSIARKEYNKTIKVMEIQLGRKKPSDKGKEKIVLDLLTNYYQLATKQNSFISNQQSLQQSRRFCETMVRYSQIVEQQTRMLRTVSELIERNKTASIELGLLREQFLSEVKKNTKSNEIAKQNEFFFYTISTNNYPAAVQEKSSLGYSAKLMLLLARSLENFEHSYLKMKSAEVFDQESSQELLTCQINERTTCECNIVTLEGISLRVKVNMQIQTHPGNQIFASKYGLSRELFKDSVVVFYFPQIEQHHLDMLYKARKTQPQTQSSQFSRNGVDGEIYTSQFQKNVKMEYQQQQQGGSIQHQIKGWGNSSMIAQQKNNEILDRYYPSAVTPNANKNTNNSLQFEAELEKIKLNTLSKQRRNIPNQAIKKQNILDNPSSNCNQNSNVEANVPLCKKEQQKENLSGFKIESDIPDTSSLSFQEQPIEIASEQRKFMHNTYNASEIVEESASNWDNNQTNRDQIKEEVIDTKIIMDDSDDDDMHAESVSQQISS